VSRTSTGGFNELAVLQLCCRLSGIGVRVISYLSVLFTFIDPCSQGHSDVATEPLHPTT
jgi:hypothetical protein